VNVDSAGTARHSDEIDLVRFLFALPSPLSVPYSWVYANGVPDGDGVPDPESDPLVALKFYQVEADEEVLLNLQSLRLNAGWARLRTRSQAKVQAQCNGRGTRSWRR